MIVCFCNELREKDVRAAARDGAGDSVESVYAHLGCRLQCGQCACYAQDLIDEELFYEKQGALIAAE